MIEKDPYMTWGVKNFVNKNNTVVEEIKTESKVF
jgi:hypothetical protein